jgi:4-hydroxymandelate oxidase
MTSPSCNRRRFLRFLAGSPLLSQAWAQQAAAVPDSLLSNPKEALNVMDFEPAARKALPPAHWGYLATGVDDDLTVQANREGFKHVQLRPRRLVDVTRPDLTVELFGRTWETPIFLCPVGSQKAFHRDGELAVARAARARRHLQILSTVASSPVEDVAQALGAPPWYQLYMPSTWDATEKMVRRVEAAGCPVLVWTVDLMAGRNTETLQRYRRMDGRDCTMCHATARGGDGAVDAAMRPMFKATGATGINPPAATWEYLDRLRKMTKMKLLLKGIETREDAILARDHGVDGILVSNHGGRATEDLRPTIESLPEVIDAVGGQIPVLVDGGFRRGSDIFKALALGARAVGIGRPYIWGLSAFGQEGVDRVLEILRAELQLVMRQCGTPSVKRIRRDSVAIKVVP